MTWIKTIFGVHSIPKREKQKMELSMRALSDLESYRLYILEGFIKEHRMRLSIWDADKNNYVEIDVNKIPTRLMLELRGLDPENINSIGFRELETGDLFIHKGV